MQLGPKIYKIQNGQLQVKDENINISTQLQTYRVIKYTHTVRATPDDYHTEIIKQIKEENEQLRKNYRQLQKAYWSLLGYCQQNLSINNQQATPIHILYKDGAYPNSTDVNQSSKNSSVNVSSFDLEQIMMEQEQSRKKLQRLSESILEEEEVQDFRHKLKEEIDNNPQILKNQQNIFHKQRQIKRLVKTQVDEDIQDLLIQAFKQVQELRQLLQTVKNSSIAQMEQMRLFYEQKIQNLQICLQKQKKQSRMLNGVINRLRDDLQSKQNFFRSVKQIRNGPQRNVLQKLLKQHKLQIL